MEAFLILSHQDPLQILRLTKTLASLYDDPPIVCHHDESQSPINHKPFSSNVHFVKPSIHTGWGKWSLIEATIRSLSLLYRVADPDWFTLLSAADYPIAGAEIMRSHLASTTADVLIDYRRIAKDGTAMTPLGSSPRLAHHGDKANAELALNRYRKLILKYPVLRTRPPLYSTSKQGTWRVGRQTASIPVEPLTSPFRGATECYVGSQWFTANRRAAHTVLNMPPLYHALKRHLKGRVVPDECFFQSLFCNQPDLKVDPNPRRFANWNGGGAHPLEIGPNMLNVAFRSGDFFARKFAANSAALDIIDRRLGICGLSGKVR